jgi:hypothetical protein
MVTKSQQKPSKKKSSKNRVKVLDLKRETLKDLTESQKKKIKGGSGRGSTVDWSMAV